MITPDSIALWKQMQALNYKPKAAFFEKGGEPVVWWSILGESAQGTMVAGYWHPDLGYPGAKELRGRFEADTGELYSQHIADAYAAAQVLLDGMERAGSVDPAAVNAAIGETDKTYVVGPVKFTEGKGQRSAALPVFMLQWQDGDLEVVYPRGIGDQAVHLSDTLTAAPLNAHVRRLRPCRVQSPGSVFLHASSAAWMPF